MLGELLDPSVVHWISISVSGACLFNYSDAEVWKVFQDVSTHLAFTTSGCYGHHWRLLVHLQKDFFPLLFSFFPPFSVSLSLSKNLGWYVILTISFCLFQLRDSAQSVESWLNMNAKIVLVNLVLDWRVLHSVLSALTQ